jgi:hypothetical protein
LNDQNKTKKGPVVSVNGQVGRGGEIYKSRINNFNEGMRFAESHKMRRVKQPQLRYNLKPVKSKLRKTNRFNEG